MTETELLAAVQEALAKEENPEGYYTTEDWAELFGLSIGTTRKRLSQLKRLGRLEAGKVYRMNLHDIMQSRPGYRFIPEQ